MPQLNTLMPRPALTSQVWYREDVNHANPEGSEWTLVDTPGEVAQISCGPHDLLWATLWEGPALVREGISRNNPKGGPPTTPIQYQPREGACALQRWGRGLLTEAAGGLLWGLLGSSWTTIEPPGPDSGILHVSVGVSVVWAVTKDQKVRPREERNTQGRLPALTPNPQAAVHFAAGVVGSVQDAQLCSCNTSPHPTPTSLYAP